MTVIRSLFPIPPIEADFSTFDKRIEMAAQGIFSIDQPAHRARRAFEASEQAKIDATYSAIGLDRAQEYRRIAARLEVNCTDGIWARSTKEYSFECGALDAQVAVFQTRNWKNYLDPYQVRIAAAAVQSRMPTRELLNRAKSHGLLKREIGRSFWVSPKGMVWPVDCAEHNYFVYTIMGELHWNALEEAGWLHVSHGRIDHLCKINASQQRPLQCARTAGGIDNFYEHPRRGGDNRPVPLDHVNLFDVRPERVSTEEKEAA